MNEHIPKRHTNEDREEEVTLPQQEPPKDSSSARAQYPIPGFPVTKSEIVTALVSALAAHSPDLGPDAPPSPPAPTTILEEVVRADIHRNPIHSHIEEAILSKDVSKIDQMIALLHSCPGCIPDVARRNEYAKNLFHALPPRDIVRLAHYLTIVHEANTRSSLMHHAVFALIEDLPAHHSLLWTAYEQYAPFLTPEDIEHLLTVASTTYPVLTAHTFHEHSTIAPLISRIHDNIINRLATHPPKKESIAGNIPLLKAFFGEAVTVSLLQEMGRTHGDTLYTEMEDVIDVLGAHHAHAFATDATILEQDPLLSLKTLHILSTQKEYVLTPRDDAVREQVMQALRGFTPPQILLRDAHEINAYINDKGVQYEEVLLSAVRHCLDSGNYQALVQYHAEIEPYVHDHTRLHAYFMEGAYQAYKVGDYSAFLLLHALLNTQEKEVMAKEYTVVEKVLETPVSKSFLEQHGTSLNPESPFSPQDLPFPPEMQRYVVNLIQESIATTNAFNQNGTYHGKPYQNTYGTSFLATPLERFNTILYAEGFKNALQETKMHLTYGYVLMLAEGVSNMLNSDGLKANNETIFATTQELLHGFERNQSRAIFGEGVRTIIATHEGFVFEPQRIAEHLHERAGGRQEDVLFAGKGVQYEEGINIIKRNLITAIEEAGNGPVTIVLDGHGSPENWGFSENTPDAINRSLAHDETSLTYQELGDAIARSKNAEVTIIVSACFADDYLRNLYTHLNKTGSTVLPRIGIATSNTGKYAWAESGFGKEQYLGSHLLNTFAKEIYATPPRNLTVGDLMRTQGKLIREGGFGVFLHAEPASKSKEKKDAKKHTPPRILEIVLNAPPVDMGTPT